ncbi:hypothetical protein ACHQM5_025322 [Ranunculus cassubicifolius]
MEGAGKGSMRSLGLVVIGVVMLLVCGVAEAGNPCYVESVQNCLNNCGLDFKGCATCPVICGMRDTCKHEINSGELEAAAMKQYCKVGCVSLVCAPMANILGLNSVADKQGSMERCNNGCSGFCTKHFGAAIATE